MTTESQIIQQIRDLFSGTDERNWEKIEGTMDDNVLLDYSSMTGSPATMLTPHNIVSSWAAFLPGFDQTHHHLSEFSVQWSESEATAHYMGRAEHFINEDVWVVEGTYDTVLKLRNEKWLISEQTFNYSQQSGNTELPALATRRLNRRTHSGS